MFIIRNTNKFAAEVIRLYRVEDKLFEGQQHLLKSHWHAFRTDYSDDLFKKCYDYERIRHLSSPAETEPINGLICVNSRRGETFPIKLAEYAKDGGYGITFFNCNKAPTEHGVRRMLRDDILLVGIGYSG